MLFAGPHLTSIRNGGADIPVGAITGYTGTLAEAAALTGWVLCDGDNDTPDLRERFIIGADDGDYATGTFGGSLTDQVAGTTSSTGAHGSLYGLGGSSSGGSDYKRGTAGAHSHPVAADLDPPVPQSRTVVYIMATTPGPLPAGAVAWLHDTKGGGGFEAFEDLRGRFAFGVSDDTRETTGSDTRAITNVRYGSEGTHSHPAGAAFGGGSTDHPNMGGGGHEHDATDEGTVDVPRPPFHALLGVISPKGGRALARLVLAYAGDTETIPEGWTVCDGTGDAPDLRGRIPIGVDDETALDVTGGDSAAIDHDGAGSPSGSAPHNHDSAAPALASYGDHSTYAWSHEHASWSGTIAPMPAWAALPFIMAL